MTPQEVIKTFMATLANHGYSYSSTVGKDMLDAAVKASSRFLDVQNVIDNMKADQIAAEREAVEEVLGSEYAGKTMAEVSSSILKANASNYVDTAISNTPNGYTTTVKRVIQERKAYIFLEKYCGIQLNTKYWFYNDTTATYTAGNSDSGNVDTGAITGSDANITLKAGDVVYGTTLTSDLMQMLAKQDGISLSGDTLIVGTGTEKTAESVVPEIGNKYTATTSTAQNIKTGSNDWIVVATGGNDTITTGGADSIDAGAGNDKIIVGADYASIVTGAGSDNIAVSSTVNNVTLCDLGIRDTLTVGGTFDVGSAQVDDSVLIVTDKTGTRTVRFDNYKNAMNAKVNGKTLTNWLGDVTIRSANSQAFAAESAVADFAAATLVDVGGQITGEDYTPDYVEPGSLAEETQQLNATNGVINLNDVTIANGTVKTSSGTIGTISNEFPNISTFTKNGLTIKLFGVASDTSGTYAKVTAKTLDQLTDAQKTIVAGLFKWWTKESLTLVKDSYGIDFNSDTAAVKEMELYFYDSNGSNNILAAAGYWFDSNGKTIQQFLKVNMNYYKSIDADDVNGAGSSNAGYIDRTLAHEFTHSIMESNIIGFNKLPQFIAEGMAELTHGIDDFRGYNIFTLANDASKLNKALNLNNTGTGETDAYAGGYMFMRYLAKQASLQTLVDYGSSDAEGTWELNKTTATYKIDGNVVATITGLKSGLVTTGTLIDGITVDSGKIILSQKVLGTSTVKLNNADGQNYTLAFDEEISHNSAVTISGKAWTFSNGTATLKGNSTAGYNLSDDGKTVTYSAAKTNQILATISGLAKTGVTADDFPTDSDVITLKSSMLGTSKITLKGDGYTLALDDSFNPQVLNPYWSVKGTTATYQYNTSAGFTLSEDGKTANYFKPVSTVLATVSGLKSGLTATEGTIDGITVDGDKISLSEKVLGTSKVTVKGNYTFALDNSLTSPSTKNRWLVNGTTATYDAVQSDYFTPSDDGKTLNYNKEKVLNNFLTVKGLAKGAKVDDNGTVAGVTLNDKTVTLAGNDLFGNKVEVKLSDGYTLDNQLTTPVATSSAWTVSKGTATFKQEMTDGYTLTTNAKTGVHTLTYSAAKTGKNAVTLATVSGLNTALTATDGSIDGIAISGDKIILSQKALGASKVTVKGNYTLALADDVAAPTSQTPYWTISGTTATYKYDTTASFTLSADGKTVNYIKPTTTTLATVSGLKSGLKATDGSIDGITISGNKITLSQKILGTSKVAVKGDYTLALADDVTAPTPQTPYWTISGTTATYKYDTTASFILSADGKTANYIKPTTTTLATVSGLKSGLKATDGSIDGIAVSGNKITLSQKVLGASKVAVKGDYTLALSDDVAAPTPQTPYWTISGTTATYKYDTTASYTLSEDGKTVNYIKPTSTTLATVSGLKSGLKAIDGSIDGITISGNKITLSQKVLGASKVAVKGDYTLALADDVAAPTQKTPYLVAKGTTATYQYDTTAGFTLSEDSKTANYSKQTATTLTTISGLKSGLKATDGSIDGITISGDKITLSQNVLGTSKVTVKGNYTLALANDVAAPTPQTPYWTVSGTTATYKSDISAGFTLSADSKAANYIKPSSTTLATVNGLKKGLTVTNGSIDGIIVSGDKISLDEKVLGTSNVTVKGNYTLAPESSLTSYSTKDRWLVSGNTATYENIQTSYFTPSDDNKKLTYNKEKTLGTFVTVKGLAKGAKVDDNGTVAGVTLNDKTVTLAGDDLFGNKVEVKLADGYTLNNRLTAPAGTTASWTVKDGTATLKQEMTEGYTLTTNAKTGVHTITYSAAKTGKNAVVLATVSGLNKTLTDSNGTLAGLVYNLNDKTIMLDKRVLGTSNITVKGDFKLIPVTSGTYAVPTTTKSDTYWTVSGTKAVYKTADIGYFTQDGDKTLKYTKENVYETHATINGLKNNAPTDSFSVSGNVITITADALDEKPTSSTKITLGKNDSYTFNLGGGIASVEYNDPTWTYSNGNATYSATVRTAGYSKSLDGKTITYIPVTEKKKPVSTTYATLSGVKSSDGIFVGDKVITVSEAALDAKKVTLSTNYDYKLAINSNVTVPTLTKTEWSSGSTTANLIGTISAGYIVTNDKTISYSKTKTQTLATITGLADKSTVLDEIGTSDKEIILSDEQLSKKVTISGDYKFVFARDYNDAAIVTSAANDTITCAGSGLSITGGKGDDYIDFGTGGNSNTFIYASGDGNDVIADFTATKDKIKITRGSIAVKGVGDDVLITVDFGTIKLEGVAGQTISIIDRTGVEKQFPTKASADLLDSDNFISVDTQLDSITDNSGALDDLNATTLANTDLTTLTKQNNIITYGNNK